MTPQTLTAERREKFRHVLTKQFVITAPNCDAHYTETENGKKWLSAILTSLVEASLSRSERATDEHATPNNIKGVEAAMMQGRPVTEEDISPERLQHDTLYAFEVAFKLDPGNIAWFNVKPEWKRLRAKLVEKYLSDPDYFKKYHKWYTEEGKFAGGMNVQQMRRDPDGFILAMNIFEAATIGEVAQKTGRQLETLDR